MNQSFSISKMMIMKQPIMTESCRTVNCVPQLLRTNKKAVFFCKMVLDQAKIVNTDTLNLYIHICKRMNIEEVVKIPKELAALIKDDHYYCY